MKELMQENIPFISKGMATLTDNFHIRKRNQHPSMNRKRILPQELRKKRWQLLNRDCLLLPISLTCRKKYLRNLNMFQTQRLSKKKKFILSISLSKQSKPVNVKLKGLKHLKRSLSMINEFQFQDL